MIACNLPGQLVRVWVVGGTGCSQHPARFLLKTDRQRLVKQLLPMMITVTCCYCDGICPPSLAPHVHGMPQSHTVADMCVCVCLACFFCDLLTKDVRQPCCHHPCIISTRVVPQFVCDCLDRLRDPLQWGCSLVRMSYS
jgi:hypothetical protein